MKYKQWLNDWLDCYVKPVSKEITFIRYKQQIDKHVLPTIGEYELDELSAHILQKFIVRLTQSGLAPNTVNCIISTVKASLKRAVKSGITNCQFTDAILRPKVREKKINSFTKREQKKIENYVFRHASDKLFGVIISLYTGLRIGELLALKWSDVDIAKAKLTVSGSCRDSWVNGEYRKVIDTTKTTLSQRTIPLPKPILKILKSMKKNSHSDYVISGSNEYGAEIRTYQRMFGNLLKKLKIPHKGFHALRHTFATRAMEVGMDVKTLSEIMGHSNPTITLKRYAHSMFEHKVDMMNKVGKLLTQQEETSL